MTKWLQYFFIAGLVFFLVDEGVAKNSELPDGGKDILKSSDVKFFRFLQTSKSPPNGKKEIIQEEGKDSILRVHALRISPHDYDLEIKSLFKDAVSKGDICHVQFEARMISSEDESGNGRFYINIQRSGPDWHKVLRNGIYVGKEWIKFNIPVKMTHDFGRGEAEIAFGFGGRPQVVEIKNIRVLNYQKKIEITQLPTTQFTYEGRELGAKWRKEAHARIEKLRKAPLDILVVDDEGKPVQGAEIEVKMTRHHFMFGSAIDVSALMGVRRWTGQEFSKEDRDKYRQAILDNFNTVGIENGMKWPVWEIPERREVTLKALDWCEEKGLRHRGHNLVWPGWEFLPRRIKKYKDNPDVEKLRTEVRERITEVLEKTRSRFEEWDVVNEPRTCHDLMDILGWEEYYEWYRLAHRLDPKAKLWVNDYSILSGDQLPVYYKIVKKMLEQKIPLHGIGVQCHFGVQPPSLELILKKLDKLSELGLAIKVTEFDINTSDEALQADFTRDLLIATFSHPQVEGFIFWGFWEPVQWAPKSALYREDWTLKPNGKVYRDLVYNQWWTNEKGISDSSGSYQIQGFLGEHTVTVRSGKKIKKVSVVIDKKGETSDKKPLKIVLD